jgi:hypothetical protein
MPNCDQPEVFFQVFTAGFRKHEGIVEREDLLNETRMVMQVDDEPPYWVDSEIRLVSKFENMIDKDFYKKHSKSDDLLFDIFLVHIKKGAYLIKEDESLVKKLSIFIPPESPYYLYFEGFNLLTFESNEFQQAMDDFAELCQKRQLENDLLLGSHK